MLIAALHLLCGIGMCLQPTQKELNFCVHAGITGKNLFLHAGWVGFYSFRLYQLPTDLNRGSAWEKVVKLSLIL